MTRRERLAVREWVLRVMRETCERKPVNDAETRLKALRLAAEYSFPTADIEQMLAEIERGYQA